jgi:hypothetical protein
MSYTEYLRRKAAAAPKVIDTTVRSDASTITMRRRLQANREFFISSRQGVINNVSDPSGTGTSSLLKSPSVTTKVNGGYIPDASTFTAFVGGTAINNDGGVFQPARRLIANSNSADSISLCVAIPEPTPYTGSGTYTANMVPQNAGQRAMTLESCRQPSTEPHIQSELSGPLFVDDTIRLKNLTSCCVNNNDIAQAIHTHPADVPHNDYQARPLKGNGGIPVFTVSSPDDARKVGNYNFPRNRHAYVERHHGNDLNVNPRRVPTKYQIPDNPPAQLKINDPNHYPVA